MILTFKVRHNNDFSIEFAKARQIVEFGLGQRKLGVFLTSKHVKHFGLKSLISNQLLRKYCKNIKTKSIKYIKLPICGQGIKFKNDVISIPCLKLSFKFHPHKTIELVKSIEIGDTYYYIACEIKCQDQIGENLEKYIGVDLNSTGHCAVVANPSTGKILKLGKNCNHIRNKYFNIRRKLQKLGKYKVIKTLGNKEQRIIRDINHKISLKIVKFAKQNQCNIKLENLKGIRKNTKGKKALSRNVNNWSFYQLQQMIVYKAKLHGIKVFFVNPYLTSQIDSKTGIRGARSGKIFNSPIFGVENADVNAAFNIALSNDFQLLAESDVNKGRSDEPQMAMATKAS